MTFYGGSGGDIVLGTNKADLLAGNGGSNVLAGGLGDDIYVVSSATDIIGENDQAGYDTVYVSVSYALNSRSGQGYIENISAQNQQGTEPINITGNYIGQLVIGNFGNNILNGNGGADTLIGLKGNDIYAIADANAVIVENPGEGHDLVYTSVSYTLTGLAEIEELSFATQAGTENFNIIGNGFNQQVIGNFGNNLLNGNGGIDTLIGLKGDDIYVVGNAASIVVENAGEGDDTIYTNVSYTLAIGASIETLSTQVNAGTEAINLNGNEYGQVLVGNNGANVISGGRGVDNLYGLGGADTFVISARSPRTSASASAPPEHYTVLPDFESGVDRIQLASAAFGLAPGVLQADHFATSMGANIFGIIYGAETGTLFYGNANDPPTWAAFAFVPRGTVLTADMITIV